MFLAIEFFSFLFSHSHELPWFGYDLMKNSQKGSARADDFQPRISEKPEWLAVPVAAERFGKQILMAILPAANPFTIASAMLQQKHSPFASAHSRHLFKRGDRIWKRASRERRDDCLKAVAPKRKRLRVGH